MEERENQGRRWMEDTLGEHGTGSYEEGGCRKRLVMEMSEGKRQR